MQMICINAGQWKTESVKSLKNLWFNRNCGVRKEVEKERSEEGKRVLNIYVESRRTGVGNAYNECFLK